MLRTPAPTSLNAFTPSTPWAVTTPRYSVTGRPSIPGVVVMSISVPPYLRLSLTRTEHVGSLGHASCPALSCATRWDDGHTPSGAASSGRRGAIRGHGGTAC